MKKVIVRTREDELTSLMYRFGHDCALQFINNIERERYGKDWLDRMYTSPYSALSSWVTLNKNGTVSVCVFSEQLEG